MKQKDGSVEVGELRKRRDALVAELAASPGWVLGSLVETMRKLNGKKTPFRYLSRSVAGKNRILYVSAAQMTPFGTAVDAGRLAVRLLEDISELNARLIKAGERP